MRRFSVGLQKYIQALYRSFYDPTQYRAIIFNWTGFGGLYLLLLSLIISAFMVGYIGYSAMLFKRDELPSLLKQIPPITIRQGAIKVEGNQPVRIKSPDNKFYTLINTDASEEDLEKENPNIGIGLDFIVVRNQNGTYQTKRLDNMTQSLHFDRDDISHIVDVFIGLLPFVIYPIAVLSQWINYLFQAFLIAIATYVVTAAVREEYNFETRMRLSALALTPALVITTISLIAFQHQMALWFNLLLALLFCYVMIILMRRLPPTDTLGPNDMMGSGGTV